MIALSSLTTTGPFPFPVFSVSSWIVYFFAAWAVIGVGVIVLVLFLEKRKHRQFLQSKSNPVP
jgi:hypothetical protein